MSGKKSKKQITVPQEIQTEVEFKKLCDAMDEQHKLFCDHYMVTLNAADSYRKAGYKAHGNSQRVNAIRLLTNANVEKYIAWKIKQRKKLLAIDELYILNVLQQATKVKITDYFDFKKDQIGKQRIVIKDLSKMPDTALQLIDSITEGQYGITIKLINKTQALEKLGAHFGMWNKDPQKLAVGEGTKYIIRRYIVPAQGNVMIKPNITPADIKEMVTQHIIESRK